MVQPERTALVEPGQTRHREPASPDGGWTLDTSLGL
jgi:hypothetical protein